jgi:Peptidase family M48
MLLKPFPFHEKLKDYFKNQGKTWEWFADEKIISSQNEAYKTDILKNSYRITKEEEPRIYELLEQAKDKLGVIIPITIYQSQYVDMNNASIVMLDKEAHLVLSGSIMKILNDDELLALLGHELSHVLLYTFDNGNYEVANRIINAIANEGGSELYYYETARMYQLYTELFCDLGAFKVCGDINPVICTLVKVNTGLEKVSAESYLQQASEILDRIETGSEGTTHPELYIRAKSLELFKENEIEYYTKIADLVHGKVDLHQLNIFTKKELHETTKELIDIILKPKWTQSDHSIVLYKHYFTAYNRNSEVFINEAFKVKINASKTNTKDYFSYVMLDFAMCDTELKEPFIGLILDLSEQLGLEENLKIILKKELKLSDKAFKEMSQKAATALNEILESEQEKTY